MASSIPGLFAAGDVRSSPFRQVVVAAAEGAIAAHCAAEYIDTLKA
jgi:thioredoxin reductase (NADPH)